MSRWRRCTVKGCVRPSKVHGLCEAHWERTRRGALKPQEPIRSMNGMNWKRYGQSGVEGKNRVTTQ